MSDKKRLFYVTIPIAGHAFKEIEAVSEEAAIEEAFNTVTLDDVDDWEAPERFNQGNVCYCPSPWEVDVEDHGEVEPD